CGNDHHADDRESERPPVGANVVQETQVEVITRHWRGSACGDASECMRRNGTYAASIAAAFTGTSAEALMGAAGGRRAPLPSAPTPSRRKRCRPADSSTLRRPPWPIRLRPRGLPLPPACRARFKERLVEPHE